MSRRPFPQGTYVGGVPRRPEGSLLKPPTLPLPSAPFAAPPSPHTTFGIYAPIIGGQETIAAAQEILTGRGFEAIQVGNAIILSHAEVTTITRPTTKEVRAERYAGRILSGLVDEFRQEQREETPNMRLGVVHRLPRTSHNREVRLPLIVAQLFDPLIKGTATNGALRLRQVALTALAGSLSSRPPLLVSHVTQPMLPLAAGSASPKDLSNIGRELRSLREHGEPITLGPCELVLGTQTDPEAFPPIVSPPPA